MAATFPKGPLLFRSRSAGRDARNDRERLSPVRTAVAAALESASRERAGLQRRLDAYCMQAASLVDNSPDYPERSRRDEHAIAEAERQMARVRRRLVELEAQIGKLSAALAELETIGA